MMKLFFQKWLKYIFSIILVVLILGVLYYLFVDRNFMSSISMDSINPAKYLPEDKTNFGLNPKNQFPYTLEQEMVDKMAPPKFNIVQQTLAGNSDFQPILDDTYNASAI